jgi:ABC-type transport system involved in cytochrome c biogenesis permease component
MAPPARHFFFSQCPGCFYTLHERDLNLLLMNFLPIVERELRVGARKRETYWMRCGVAVSVLGVALFVILFHQRISAPVPLGKMLLHFMTFPVLVFTSFSGLFLTATSIAEEKRQGTLGLLFLTSLRGHDVVLGKFMAHSYRAILGTMAMVPILTLPLLFGGVTFAEVGRVSMALGVTLFFSVSAGIFVSSFSREPRQALGGTLLLMLCFYGLLPAIYWSDHFARFPADRPFLLWGNPAVAWKYAFDGNFFGRGMAVYYWSLSLLAGLGLMFLLVASLRLIQEWRKEEGRQAAPEKPSGPRGVFSALTKRVKGALPLTQQGAELYEWLALREGRGWVFYGVFVLILPFLGGALLAASHSNIGPPAFIVAMFIAFGLHQLCKILMVIESSRRLFEDRQNGVLELLLVTPLQPRHILRGQRQALWKQFRRPSLILIGLNLVMWFWTIIYAEPLHTNNPEERRLFFLLFFGSILMLLADLKALSWNGMFTSLIKPKWAQAVCQTYLKIMLPPWVMFFVLFVTVGSSRAGGPEHVFVPWIFLSLIYAMALAARARWKLMRMRVLLGGAPEAGKRIPHSVPRPLAAGLGPA